MMLYSFIILLFKGFSYKTSLLLSGNIFYSTKIVFSFLGIFDINLSAFYDIVSNLLTLI
jgi:hypothetical protein